MDRIRVSWQTGAGGLGVATFYALDDETAAVKANLATFFNAIKSKMPTSTSVTIPASGDTMDPTTGDITGTWTAGTSTTVTGTGSISTYAAGTGMYVNWLTAGIRAGRRVRGRTFLAPLTIEVYALDGTPDSTTLSTFQAAASALAGDASASIGVWSRPTDSLAGQVYAITGATVPDRVTSLASRRR